MKIFRLIFASIIFLAVVLTIISLFIPSDIRISKAVQVYSSPDSVYQQVARPENWKNWYPGLDSAKSFYEAGNMKGYIFDQTSKQRLVVTNISRELVNAVYELKTRKIPTGWQLIPASDANSVTVEWFMEIKLRWYPWEKFSSLMFENIYGTKMQQGLNNLKALLEK